MYDYGCFALCSFKYISSPYGAHDFLEFLPNSANLAWRLTQEVANHYYLRNPCFQNADQVKPVQRHELYNSLLETLLQCAKILALQPSVHFRISYLCDCTLNSKR